jgi:hypothetical protein
MAKLLLFVMGLVLCGTRRIDGGEKVLVLHSSGLDSLVERNFRIEFANYKEVENLSLILHDLNTSSCKGQEARAVAAFIEEVFEVRREGDDVVATLGPSCTDSAYAISRLASRREVSMVHLHTSPIPASLASRAQNSFGLLAPVEFLADVGIELIQYASWYSVVAFYEDTDTEMNYMFNHFRQQLARSDPHVELGYSSTLRDEHLPLEFILSHYAIRIIFIMQAKDSARRTLCKGYHQGAVYPHYQWVIFRTSLEDLLDESTVYIEGGNQCGKENIVAVLDQAILLGYDSFKEMSRKQERSLIGKNTLQWLFRGVKMSQNQSISLSAAFCQLRPEVENYIHIGQVQNGSGVSVEYNKIRNTFTRCNGSEFNILPSNFTRINDLISAKVFYFTLAVIATQAFITILMHILTVYYRRMKAVRATSLNIQQIVYFGIYMVMFTNLIYAVQKGLQMDDRAYAFLCNMYHFVTNVSYTLVLGSLCVKTWRLYRIFNHFADPGDLLSDRKLTVTVLSLTLVDIAISTLWVTVGDPVRTERPIRTDFQEKVEIVQDACRTRYYLVWFLSAAAYHAIQLCVALVLSIKVKSVAPRHQKQFRRNEIVLLTYLTSVLAFIGYPTYFLARRITGDLMLEYVVAVTVPTCNVTLFLVLFFAFPLLRAFREDRVQRRTGKLLD